MHTRLGINVIADELNLRMNALNDFKQATVEYYKTTKIPAFLSVVVLSNQSRVTFNFVIMYFNYSYIF